MWLFDPDRRLIVEHKFLLGDDRVPAFCALSRLQLHKILLGAVERAGVEVRLGVTVSAIHEDKDRVDVEFSTGQRELVRSAGGLRRHPLHHPAASGRHCVRAAPVGLWRLAGAGPPPDDVRGMEFLQGIGSKTGAMPLGNDIMYLFHIRPEARRCRLHRAGPCRAVPAAPGAVWRLRRRNLRIAEQQSDIVYSPIEPLLLPWPWCRGRVAIGGDAAHTFAPHLTQGAAMAAEDAFVLAREVLADDVPVEARLMRYSQKRYARCAFVYTFSGQWMHDEQSVRSAADLEAARAELTLNASAASAPATASSMARSRIATIASRYPLDFRPVPIP